MADLKTSMATKNGFSEERYVELVRAGVKVKYPDKADEISLLRKEIALLRKVIEKELKIVLPPSNFPVYDEYVEGVKVNSKIEVTS